jgi:hypothetical protein
MGHKPCPKTDKVCLKEPEILNFIYFEAYSHGQAE